MSYSCDISFKKLETKEIYPFLQKLKEEAEKKVRDIVVDDNYYSPIYKHAIKDDVVMNAIKDETFLKGHNSDFIRIQEENENWGLRLFSFRWYWDDEHNVLMMYSIPKQLKHLFDNSVYFQNSCDQDYDFEDWSGIQYMEDIANKWKNMSDEEVVKSYKESQYYDYNNHDEEEYIQKHLEYYRRTMCYDEIWNRIEWTLYNDREITYITLFNKWYDFLVMEKCDIAIVESIKEEFSKSNKEKE